MNDTLYLHGLVGGGGDEEWTRPSDWIAMPATAANTIDILAAVFNHDSNYCSVKISTSTGTYSVDWGDGTTDTGVASNAQIDHLYSYADGDLGALTSRGYKQALIRITPATGNITAVNLNVRHARTNLQNQSSSPWLDIAVNAASATVLSFNANTTNAAFVERIVIHAIGAVTSMASCFKNCFALREVSFPAGSLASVTATNSMFEACRALRKIDFPAGSLASVGNASKMFEQCSALREIIFPAGSLVSTTNIASFNECRSLRKIEFPSGSLSLVTTLAYGFTNCTSLETLTFPAGSLGAVTTIEGAFDGCSSLYSLDLASGLDSTLTAVTNGLRNLQSLSVLTGCTIPVSFSIASARLSGTALNAVYTSLPTVTAKTITVTGNHGIADHDPTIATAKGWTVTT